MVLSCKVDCVTSAARDWLEWERNAVIGRLSSFFGVVCCGCSAGCARISRKKIKASKARDDERNEGQGNKVRDEKRVLFYGHSFLFFKHINIEVVLH